MLLIIKHLKNNLRPFSRHGSLFQNLYNRQIVKKRFEPFDQFELFEQFFIGTGFDMNNPH
jgi:hypothetical protein